MTQALILLALAAASSAYFLWLWRSFWREERLAVGRRYWLSSNQMPLWPHWPPHRRYPALLDLPWFLLGAVGIAVIWSEPGEGPGSSHRIVTTIVFAAAIGVGLELSRRLHNRSVVGGSLDSQAS